MQLIQSTLFVIPSFCHSWCSSKPKHVQQCPLRCFWHTDYVQVLIFLPNNLSMDTANCKQLRSPACCNTHSAASSPPALSLSFYIPPSIVSAESLCSNPDTKLQPASFSLLAHSQIHERSSAAMLSRSLFFSYSVSVPISITQPTSITKS